MELRICRSRLTVVLAVASAVGVIVSPGMPAVAKTMVLPSRASGDNSHTTEPKKSAYDFNLPGPNGEAIPLANFKGKIVLLVNLARKSSYASQLPSLIKLNDTYRDKGLVVIGIPSNDFGASEPGTEDDIKKAYADAKVDFPVMMLSKLTGDDQIPLYTYLTKSDDAPAGGPVHWNFSKFILDRNGKVIARLDPAVTPDSPEMISTLEEILAGTYKPKKGKVSSPDGKDMSEE